MDEERRARSVAIIADGNRRWARARGLPVIAGYQAGVEAVRAVVRDALELGVEQLVVFAFSTENWRRSSDEVAELLDLFRSRLFPEAQDLAALGARVTFVGRPQPIPTPLQCDMRAVERLTADGEALRLFIALNYGGRAELVDAAHRYRGGGERELRSLLYAPEMRDPDILIRTGGDKRLSNFMLWQMAYTELVFRDELWPDFRRQHLEESLAEFAARRRRFGGREALTPPA